MVPVTRRLLADGETAVGIYRKLAANRPGTVLLESAEQGKQWSRFSFVGVRSAGVLTERDGAAQWLGEAVRGLTDDLPADPLAAVHALARGLRSPRTDGLPPLTGGRSEERRGGEGGRYWRDWSSDVCSSDLRASSGRGSASWASAAPAS